jgi:hypothetical protein
MNNIEDQLRYPIGKFVPLESYSEEVIQRNIERIAALPAKIETAYKQLSPALLETAYREGGWTARQVIHHLADSHLNAYIRIKWTLTEETPTIKAYDEKRWAETPEIGESPELSIQLLKALHQKFTVLLRNIRSADLKKEFVHPETKKHISIERMIALYAWHGEHHLGHLNIIASKRT